MTRKSRPADDELPLVLAPTCTSLVLVGMMGAGKTSVGRLLAVRLHLPFVDTDDEIVDAAGRSIPEIFADFGEAAFRDGERRVIARLLEGPPKVLATGGGAFADERTRARIQESGAVSVWLRADVAILHERTRRKGNRPLLDTGDARATLERLTAEREPFYRLADVAVDAAVEPLDITLGRVISGLQQHGALVAAAAGAPVAP